MGILWWLGDKDSVGLGWRFYGMIEVHISHNLRPRVYLRPQLFLSLMLCLVMIILHFGPIQNGIQGWRKTFLFNAANSVNSKVGFILIYDILWQRGGSTTRKKWVANLPTASTAMMSNNFTLSFSEQKLDVFRLIYSSVFAAPALQGRVLIKTWGEKYDRPCMSIKCGGKSGVDCGVWSIECGLSGASNVYCSPLPRLGFN